MKNKRLQKYLEQKAAKKNTPLTEKQDVQNIPDKHIDQDFPGYPHAPSKEELINPGTKQQKKTASLNTKDGEKIIREPNKKGSAIKKGEEESDGSANAFEGTERSGDDE